MILIDSRIGSRELHPIIKRIGVPCELTQLEYGDAALEGNGPDGPISIGVERKTLHDMLACVEDARYSAHQLPGMKALYDKSFLMLEGMWECGNNALQGVLVQGFNHGNSWGPLRTAGNRQVLYSKLYRYLVSVALSGVIITYSNSLTHTAQNIVELYGYFGKQWRQHTALREVQKLNIPVLGHASLCRRWAQEITDVGVIHGEEAERLFRTGLRLANSDESDWLKLPRIGVKTAQQIVREIRDWK